MTIEEPMWTPFKGYTIRQAVEADSKEVCSFDDDAPGFAYLERCIDGQWYRLGYSQDRFPFHSFALEWGGEESGGLQGSIVQKDAYDGTRLESEAYRVVLEMKAQDGTPHDWAADFAVA